MMTRTVSRSLIRETISLTKVKHIIICTAARSAFAAPMHPRRVPLVPIPCIPHHEVPKRKGSEASCYSHALPPRPLLHHDNGPLRQLLHRLRLTAEWGPRKRTTFKS